MQQLIINIGKLVGILPEGVERLCGTQMNEVAAIDNAWLLIEDGRIADFGPMELCPVSPGGLKSDCPVASCRPATLNDPEDSDFVSLAQENGQNPALGSFETGLAQENGQNPAPGIQKSSGGYGKSSTKSFTVIDAGGGYVMPTFCDPHTHIVYAGCRDGEYRDKIAGLSYEEIAARGGGILNSADLLHQTSEDELYRQAMERVDEIIAMGTGAVEIKSGYGLNIEDELKMLRVIRRIKEDAPLAVKATFLGAHAVGRAFAGRQADYVDHICSEMLPAVAAEGLADYVDVFCDKGFFTAEDTAKILEAASKYGIRPKIHANELDENSGGVQVGVQYNALSVDHLERTGDKEIETLRSSGTMPTMLPGTSFFLGIPYGNAKGFIESGLPLALASDYNPGSSPSGDMRFVMSLGCIRMRLTPEQSFNACTINAACAMGVSRSLGSITRGKKASLILTKPVPSLAYLTYAHHTPFIRQVLL